MPAPTDCKLTGANIIPNSAAIYKSGLLRITTSNCNLDGTTQASNKLKSNSQNQPQSKPQARPQSKPQARPQSKPQARPQARTQSCPTCNKNLLKNNIPKVNNNNSNIRYDNKDSSAEVCNHCLVTIGDEKHCNKFLDKEDCDYLGDSYSWQGN